MNENYKLYKHTSPSGKVYIGITCQEVEDRWRRGNTIKMEIFKGRLLIKV